MGGDRALNRKLACLILALAALILLPRRYTSYASLVLPDELVITSGVTRFTSLSAPAGVAVMSGATLIVDGDLNAGDHLECYGGSIVVTGRVTAKRIWLSDDNGIVSAELCGDVSASCYTQSGGEVIIYGALRCDSAVLTGAYADGHGTSLTVGGKLDVGGGLITGEDCFTGLDEVSLRAFESARCSRAISTQYGWERYGGAGDVSIVSNAAVG
jgi:hypothetical protein